MRRIVFSDQVIEHAALRLGAEAMRPQFVDCMFYDCRITFAPEAYPITAPIFRRCWFENCVWSERPAAACEDCRFYWSPPDQPPAFAVQPPAPAALLAPPDDLAAPDAWI